MVDVNTFRSLALSFPGTEENPHFDRAAFKVVGRRIFASLLENENSANIKLSPSEQTVFCEYNVKSVYPVANKFGLQGWTTFNLTEVPQELVAEALLSAYKVVINHKKQRK